ncbi:hypothetical protein BAE44_0016219 [Dichanthelium oligosanthes]|uniref:Uncharacterized protein n=1 Tax=Dichanthelium oligosanthes TaxID=888268 RepID=A0A1E5VC85_9POAL|nr:hypothetical protein BAE44_0016219 [Dichanthelium oligosanthes]
MKSLEAKEKEKAKDAAGGGAEANKRPTAEDDKATGGGSWASGKNVHPCAGTVTPPTTPNGGRWNSVMISRIAQL